MSIGHFLEKSKHRLNDTGHGVEEDLTTVSMKLAELEVMFSGFTVFATHTHRSKIEVMSKLVSLTRLNLSTSC